MDYENKKTLVIIKQMVADGKITQEDAEKYFPELKESDDEKISKKIIATIHLYYGEPLEDEAKEMIVWLEKQDKCKIDYPQNNQDSNCPNGSIVLEDFNGGEGFYKVHLDYLNKKQVEEIEEMIRVWNKDLKTSNENIKDCIGMCLTDVNEQRFKDYGTNLRDCLAWLEKQGEQNYKIIKGKNYFCVKTHNYAGVEWNKGTKYYASDNYTLVNQGRECYCPEYSKEEHNNLFEEVKYDGCVERQGEQKPAWSEENKKNLNQAIYVCHQHGYTGVEKWLKSIRPQQQWKPSDEQMDALRYVVNHYVPTATETLAWDALNTTELMLEQLEKLREG